MSDTVSALTPEAAEKLLRAPTVRKSTLFTMGEGAARCLTCERKCSVTHGKVGFCQTRMNIDGQIHTLVYGDISSISVNPIEKKPFFHFWPGSRALTIGTWGCNFTCPWCIPEGEAVLTREGITPVEEVYSYMQNGRVVELFTHKGRFRKIVRAFSHPFNGYLVAFRPAYLNQYLHVTPSHNILIQRDGELRKIPARLLQQGDAVLVPIPRPEEVYITSYLNIKEIALQSLSPLRKKKSKITEDLVKDAKILITRGLSWRQIYRKLGSSDHLRRAIKHNDPNYQYDAQPLFEDHGKLRIKYGRSWLPQRVRLDEDVARLIGYYLAEGYVTRHKDRVNSYTMSLVFNENEDRYIEDVCSILRGRFGIEPVVWRDKKYHIRYVTVYNSLLALVFRILFGASSTEKKLPMDYLFLPVDLQKEIVKGYFRGDGLSTDYVLRSYGRFQTHERAQVTPHSLRAQIFLMLTRLGLIPSLIGKEVYLSDAGQTERMLSLIEEKDVRLDGNAKHRKLFGTLDSNYLYLKIRDVTSVPYTGFVYNFEVKEDHTYSVPFVAVGNCQNFDISKTPPNPKTARYTSPADLVRMAAESDCQGTSISFNEPTMMLEYALDLFPLTKRLGLYNTYVSNGYMTVEALRRLRDAGLDAIKFDVKGNADAVRRFCDADVGFVWRNVKEARELGMHVEVVVLLIPGVNDGPDSIEEVIQSHLRYAGPNTPLHFTRFHPNYRMLDRGPTPIETLEYAHTAAKKMGVNYVYLGNCPGHKFENTYCQRCGELLIERYIFEVLKYRLGRNCTCPACGQEIPITGRSNGGYSKEVWMDSSNDTDW